jgi:hypothetical protein
MEGYLLHQEVTRMIKRVLLVLIAVSACTSQKPAATEDSTFAAMQNRGQMAMGVDQYKSTHKFEVTGDGGRIELQSDKGDALEVAQIRAHLRLIQHSFEAGDFTTPTFVHSHEMPGTAVLTAKRGAITYTYADLPRGGEVRIHTSDPEVKKAIKEFLNAQGSEHHVMR